MKTQREIELMLDKVNQNINDYSELAFKYNKERNREMYEYYELLYCKAISKHNMLLEILR